MDTKRSPTSVAFALTRRSTHRKYMMAAVLVDRSGRVFAWGWNHTPGVVMEKVISLHAEHHAIIRANRARIRGATIIVVGVTKKGRVIVAKPCEHCEALIQKYGIVRVIYSTPAGFKNSHLRQSQRVSDSACAPTMVGVFL